MRLKSTLANEKTGLATTALLLAAIIWLFFILKGNIEELKYASISYNYYRILAAVPLAALTVYASAITFYVILSETSATKPPFFRTFLPYLNAQIVRYLPGKFWGVIYQAKKMEQSAPAHAIWETNIIQLIIGNILSALAALWVILRYNGLVMASYILLASCLLIFYLMLHIQLVQKITRTVLSALFKNTRTQKVLPNKRKPILIISSLSMEWIIYFSCWIVILYPIQSLGNVLNLSIVYAASWALGFMVFFIPAGAVIRESIFIRLGSLIIGMDVGTLGFIAIIARSVFSMADILAPTIAHVALKKYI